jgi:SAM-dependent methyltransferase
MIEETYDDEFFAYHEQGSRESARAVIPVLFEYVRPASVVDVGCGTGAWLAEFKAAGVEDYLGIDGDYVDRASLLIEPERFLSRDLSQPFDLDRRFDLAVSLEVAEHLPETSAPGFIASLVRLAPVVLFSAAIPHQGGTGHVNEQWPEYWNQYFRRREYVVVDCLRRRLWRAQDVRSWYRQNMLLFVERARLGNYPALAAAVEAAGPDPPLGLVHPTFYYEHHRMLETLLRSAQRDSMRHALRLRELGLVVFPNWSQPQSELRRQLRALLAVVASHPGRSRVSLVIQAGNQPAESVRNLLGELASELAPQMGPKLAEGPKVCGVNDSLDRQQWGILLECLQWRVVLDEDDVRAIAAAGAEEFPALSLGEIER